MKRFLLFAIAILFIPGICLAASDDGIQTPDKRLEQKVNIKVTGMPLGDFLTKLSAKTGVKMTARKDVADNKLAIYVKDLPLSDLQDAINQVLHLHCTRTGEKDNWKYEFWMDLKTKQKVDESKEKEIKKLQDYMQGIVDELNLSPEELAKKYKGKEEFLLPTRMFALEIYGTLSKQQLDSMWLGRTLSLNGNALPPDFRTNIAAEINHLTQELDNIFADTTDAETFGDEDGDTSMFEDFKDITGVEWKLDENPYTGEPELVCKLSETSLPDGTTSSGGFRSFKHSFSSSENDSEKTPEDETVETSEDTSEKTPAGKNVKIDSTKPLLRYQLLAKIAEQADIDIVSDYFTCLSFSEVTPEESNELETVSEWLLQATFIEGYLSRITQKADLFMISNHLWYKLKNREIPKRLSTQWKEIQKKQGYLGLKEAMEISRLDKVQISDLPFYNLGNGNPILDYHNLLVFLDSFTPEQWAQAFTEDGLPLSDIKENQYRLLKESALSDSGVAYILHYEMQDQENGNASEFNFQAIKLEEQTIKATANKCAHDSWTFGAIRKNDHSTALLDMNVTLWPDESVADPLDTEEIIELIKP